MELEYIAIIATALSTGGLIKLFFEMFQANQQLRKEIQRSDQNSFIEK